ncbi:Growth-regulating factor [Psidium guajava]|nr:Growth-regulating factor [Psidium guajava]
MSNPRLVEFSEAGVLSLRRDNEDRADRKEIGTRTVLQQQQLQQRGRGGKRPDTRPWLFPGTDDNAHTIRARRGGTTRPCADVARALKTLWTSGKPPSPSRSPSPRAAHAAMGGKSDSPVFPWRSCDWAVRGTRGTGAS